MYLSTIFETFLQQNRVYLILNIIYYRRTLCLNGKPKRKSRLAYSWTAENRPCATEILWYEAELTVRELLQKCGENCWFQVALGGSGVVGLAHAKLLDLVVLPHKRNKHASWKIWWHSTPIVLRVHHTAPVPYWNGLANLHCGNRLLSSQLSTEGRWLADGSSG